MIPPLDVVTSPSDKTLSYSSPEVSEIGSVLLGAGWAEAGDLVRTVFDGAAVPAAQIADR